MAQAVPIEQPVLLWKPQPIHPKRKTTQQLSFRPLLITILLITIILSTLLINGGSHLYKSYFSYQQHEQLIPNIQHPMLTQYNVQQIDQEQQQFSSEPSPSSLLSNSTSTSSSIPTATLPTTTTTTTTTTVLPSSLTTSLSNFFHSTSSFHTLSLQVNADDDDKELKCSDVSRYKGDRCTFVRDMCEAEGFIAWLEITYCYFGDNLFGKLLALVLYSIVLFLSLLLLSSTADLWLVPSLTVVTDILRLSPAVAGCTLLSLANGAPDVITSLTALKSGAADGEIGLVLGSLSGATMCIACLILGLSLLVANDNTLLSNSSFRRNMAGLVLCILPTYALIAKGSLRWWDGIICIGLYLIYIIGSVILLQKQQKQKDVKAAQVRKESFMSSFSSLHISQSTLNEPLLYDDSFDQNQNSSFHHNYNDNNNNSFLVNGNSINNNSFLTTLQSKSVLSDLQLNTTNTNENQSNTDPNQQSNTNQNDNNSEQNQDQYTLHDIDTPGGTTLPITKIADTPDDDDDEDDVNRPWYMEGLHFDPKWKALDNDGAREVGFFQRWFFRLTFLILWPFSVLRWISIPATDIRPDRLEGPKKILLHISPFFSILMIGLFFLETDFEEYAQLWVILILVGILIVVALNIWYFFYVLPAVDVYNQLRSEARERIKIANNTDHDPSQDHMNEQFKEIEKWHLGDNDKDEDAKPFILSIYMVIISSFAFCSSVAWLGLISQEIVDILQTLGYLFGISETFLGMTVLAIGNSFPDGASDVSLARSGKMAFAYSAIWSAPVLSNSFGMGVAILIATLTGDTPVITYKISPQVLVCWISVVICIVTTIVAYLVLFHRKPPSKFGYVLCALYGIFFLAAIIVEAVFH